MALRELQERLKAVLADSDKLLAVEKPTADDNARLDILLEEGAGLKGQIERAQRLENLNDFAGKQAPMLKMTGGATLEGMRRAGEATIENLKGSIIVNDEGEMLMDKKMFEVISQPEYGSAFKSYLRSGSHGLKADALKVLQEGADTSGGYLVPPDILNRLIAKEPAPQTVQSRVTRLTTSRDQLQIPKVRYTTDNQYTSGMRVTWTGEVPASATDHRVTDPVFGQAVIPIYTAMMSLPLTNDMVEDSAYPIVNWSTSKFEETLSLLYEDMILNGTANNRPSGILVNPNATDNPATVVSGAASALTADGLISLAFALPEQYDRNAAFCMNKTNCAQAIAKLKDGDGRYLWGSGLQDSGLTVPIVNTALTGRTLLGYPVAFNAFMPNIAASAYPIVFGDFAGYYLVNRIGFSIQVLRELYAETNQILLLGRVRFGGKVIEDWRLKIQQVSA